MNRGLTIALQICGGVLSVALVFLCVFRCGAMWGFSYPLYIVTGVLGFIVSWFVIACLHEAGHLVFGLFNGFRVERIKVFNILISRIDGKMRPSVERMSSFIGLCEMYPATCGNIKRNYLMLTVGGVTFTGAAFIAAAILFFVPLGVNIPVGGYAVYSFFLMWLPAAFFYTFFNAVPFFNDDGYSDGAVIAGLIRNDPSQQVALSALKIQTEMYKGLSPKQIDPYLYFDVPQVMETDPAFIMITQLRYMYYMDKWDYVSAVGCVDRLEKLYDEISPAAKGDVAMDILFTYSIGGGDFERTDTYFSDCADALRRKTARSCIVMAAYELSFDRKKEARAFIDEAFTLTRFEPIRGKALYEESLARGLKKFL